MVNNRLENWLKDGLKKGYSVDMLRKKALENYSEKDVDDAIANIKGKKPSNTKILVIIGIIIILIAASAAVYMQLIKPSPEKERCIEKKMQQCLALITTDENWCETYNKSDESCKNDTSCDYNFYLGKSLRTNNLSWCDKMANPIEKEVCRAFVNKNDTFCNIFGEGADKEDCVLFFSLNKESCYNINNSQIKGGCLVLNTSDAKYCKYLTEEC